MIANVYANNVSPDQGTQTTKQDFFIPALARVSVRKGCPLDSSLYDMDMPNCGQGVGQCL
jgi:hypothetical protein